MNETLGTIESVWRVIPTRAEAVTVSETSKARFERALLKNTGMKLDEQVANRWWPLAVPNG